MIEKKPLRNLYLLDFFLDHIYYVERKVLNTSIEDLSYKMKNIYTCYRIDIHNQVEYSSSVYIKLFYKDYDYIYNLVYNRKLQKYSFNIILSKDSIERNIFNMSKKLMDKEDIRRMKALFIKGGK